MHTAAPASASHSQGCPFSGLGAQYKAFEHEGVHEFFKRARQDAPVFYSPDIGYWVVTRRDDVMTVLRDTERFSASPTLEPVTEIPKAFTDYLKARNFTIEPVQSNTDKPQHTRIRMAAGQFLNAKRYASFQPQVRALVQSYVQAMQGRAEVDLIADLAYELPARVVFLLLGISDFDPRQIKRWGFNRAMLTWGRLPAQDMMDAGRELADFFDFSRELVEKRRKQPGDDYPSKLLSIQSEGGDVLTDNQIVCLVFALLLAGHEAVTTTMGNVLFQLLDQPGVWQRLAKEPALIPNAVEEAMRFNPGMFNWRRRAIEAVEIGGVTVPKDARILVSLGSANRDDAHFQEPDAFDIERANAREHLSFGNGSHVCIGAPLARFQLVTVVEELSKAFPSMRLKAEQPMNWIRTICPRGLTSIPALPQGGSQHG